MCILMYFGPNAMPVKDHLTCGCDANPDGFGYAVLTLGDRGIITGHSMDADSLIAEFLDVRAEFPQQTALFHARITTHGSTTVENAHPFHVKRRININGVPEGDMVLAHNGVLPCQPMAGDKRSDTRILAEDVLMRRFPHLDSVKTRQRLEAWMGYSKVAILTTDFRNYRQQSYIFNSELGDWQDPDQFGGSVWYSNDSWRPRVWSYKGYESTTLGYSDVGRSTKYTYACDKCRFRVLECRCTSPGEYVWLDSWMVRSKDDDDAWALLACAHCGDETIHDEDGMCETCGTMQCCGKGVAACRCWLPSVGALTSGNGDGSVS